METKEDNKPDISTLSEKEQNLLKTYCKDILEINKENDVIL